MVVPVPIGKHILGGARIGDGATAFRIGRSRSLALTYTISVSRYAVPLSLTYTIEKKNVAPLLLYYLITPPSSFAINGNGAIVRPDSITYTPRQVSARTLLGGPLLQGYTQMVWNYSVLQWAEFQTLVQYYNPQSPLVTLTYPDEHGTWVQRQVVMTPPTYGTMIAGQVVTGISFTFTRLF